ncbi:hypothetical protein SHEWT2_01229 [Shewanella hafniensis]|nr:hypothetical protein SHEWT2_01229 [Shewanella hafniensis]
MPPVIVGIAAGVAAAGVVSTAAAIAIGIGAAALTYAATPKFDGGSFANEAFSQQQMLRSPVEPRRGIYGRAMVSGPLVFAEETGTDNAYLHLVIPLAGHRCDGVEKIYFGDEVAWANGALTSKYASVARLKIHLGNQTTSDPDLTAECSQWTSAHVGFGVTYLYARLKFDTKVFPNGVPNIKALVRGKQVFDPRNANHDWEQPTTWTWSDNWALCCLDYNRFESGVGAAAHEIDLSYFAAAANDSDQLVEYQAGKFEKRYTCNGTYNQDVSPSSIMEKMLTAGAGMHVYVSGQYRLYAGVYQGPEVLVLTEDDAAGDIDVRPYTPRAELCNAVRGTFVDPENFYQPTDFPPYESSYYRAQDDGEYIDHDLDLPFTQSVWTAQRLGKLYLEQKRAGMQISMPIKMIGVAVSVGKVVGLSLPRLGIDGTFQVVDWQFDYGKPVSLILVETSAELFDFAMGSYTERDLTPNVILPNPATVPTPVGLQYVEYQDDPQWQGELTWSAPANNSSYRYVIEVSNGLGEVVYQTNADATRLLLPKFDTGFYTVSLWALNLFANRSNVPATITIGATLPAPVTGIEVIAGPLTLTLRPTTAAQIAQTTQFEILGSITNNIADATLIGTGKDAVWPDRHPNTRYQVWARTINNYGVSSWYGPVQATTSADNSSIIDLIGNTFKSYTWFAWADDNQGTGFTTVEALGDGKAYMGIATDKETASPSGNWQEYTWTKIKADIGPIFTPEEEAKLDNLMAGKLPNAPDKDMLAAQDALNNPALANNLITALSLLNQGINAPALGGETPTGAQSKASSAQSAAIAAAAADATTKSNNAKAAAESYALAKANLAETTAKAYADGIVSDEEARAIADAQAKADAAKAAAIAAAAADAASKDSSVLSQALSLSVSRETFSFNLHYRSAVILLIPYAQAGDNYQESEVIGQLTFRRGGSASTNRTERLDIAVKSAYTTTNASLAKLEVSWNWKLVACNYKGKKWLALDAKGNIQDARIEFWGRRTLGGIAGYDSTDQFKVIDYYRTGEPSFGTGVINEEIYSSIVEITAQSSRNANGTQLENVTDSQTKATTAELNAVNTVALGNFIANIGLISTLIADAGLFNQLQARIGSFGGLTANSIAALAIATNHLQSGAVTADKITADTALIQKLIANVGLFNQLQAQLAVFGGLAANSIAANAITVDKLDVRARSLVNNVSQTGVRTGWSGGVVVDHTHKGKVTKALEVSSSGDTQFFSDWFDIDHTKIYEVNFTIHRISGGLTGDRYVGINADGDGIVKYISAANRTVGSDTNNFYFWSGDIVDGQYRQMRGYIIGSEVNPLSIPESLNVHSIALLNPSSKKVRLRALNFYNGGVTTVDRWLNMSVTELGGGQISANQLLADSGLFNQLKAKIASFGGLTANEIQADTALINKLVGTSGLFNDLVARLAVFGGITTNAIAAGAVTAEKVNVTAQTSSSGVYTSFKLKPADPTPLRLSEVAANGALIEDIFYVDRAGNGFFRGILSKDTVDIQSIQDTARKQINPFYLGTTVGNKQEILTTASQTSGATTALPAVVVNGGTVNVTYKYAGGSSQSYSSFPPISAVPQWRVDVYRGSTAGALVHSKVFTGTRELEIESEINWYQESLGISIEGSFTDTGAAESQVYVAKVTAVNTSLSSINRRYFGAESPNFLTNTMLKSANGWWRDKETGLILQWGTDSFNANAVKTITLPTSFPTLCVFAGANSMENNAAADPAQVYAKALSTISIINGANIANTVTWFALGY